MRPFHVVGGILHHFVTRANGEISSALVVPVSMQYELLRAAHAHCFAGHKGTAITSQRLREKYWWPSMVRWVRMHADLFTVGKKSKKGHKYVLVITNAFSKLVELVPLADKEAKTVAAAIVDTWVCRYACPNKL